MIGQPLPRIEDFRLLTGAGRYVDDVPDDDDLHMFFVRSPVAAGRIKAIDCAAARQAPGVVAVYTARDLASAGVGTLRSAMQVKRSDGSPMLRTDCPLLADGHVQFAGDPIVTIVADTPAAARDAAEMVVLDIDESAAVLDVREAMTPGAPVVWPGAGDNEVFCFQRGDLAAVETAMATASHRIRAEMSVSRVSANPLETRGARSLFDPETGRSTLWTGTQVPHRFAEAMARTIGIEPDDLHLAGIDIGGGFGMRNTTSREGAVVVWAARRLGRPVRWIASRSEGLISDPHGRDRFTTAELALDADYRFLALKVEALGSVGGYVAPNGLISLTQHFSGLTGVYHFPAAHFAIRGVMTNNQQTTPYRGAGRPEATYTIERLIDIAARRLGIDRIELRSRNMLTAEDMPCRTALDFTIDSGDFPAAMHIAQAEADWSGFAARRRDSLARGKLRGRGLAMAIEGAGGPYGNPNGEFAELRFEPGTGTLTAAIGSSDSGQGHRTTFAQLVASDLGLSPSAIAIETGDTDKVRNGFGSVGSRTVISAGTALRVVCQRVIETGRILAAERLGAEPYGIEFRDGIFEIPGTNRNVGLVELAKEHGAVLSVADTIAPEDATFPNACHICEVEVDPATGATDIKRYTVVDDVGTVLNPLLMKGQIHGGIAQGVGQALMEQIVYDESGQLLTGSFMDYAMPRAANFPFIEVLSNPVPTSRNPLGAKGAGEAGTVGGLPVVISAVCDALAELGIEHIDMPATPARVWQAIRDKQVESDAQGAPERPQAL